MAKVHRSAMSPEMEAHQSEWIGVTEAASRLCVSASTIQRFVDEGVLDAWKTGGGHRRISRESIQALQEQRFSEKLKLRILISDGSDEVRETLCKALQNWNSGLDILTSAHGVEAIMLIERHKPDLWITSMDLASLDSLGAAKWLAINTDTSSMGILIGHLESLPTEQIASLEQLGVQIYRLPWPMNELRGVIANAIATKTRLLRKLMNQQPKEER